MFLAGGPNCGTCGNMLVYAGLKLTWRHAFLGCPGALWLVSGPASVTVELLISFLLLNESGLILLPLQSFPGSFRQTIQMLSGLFGDVQPCLRSRDSFRKAPQVTPHGLTGPPVPEGMRLAPRGADTFEILRSAANINQGMATCLDHREHNPRPKVRLLMRGGRMLHTAIFGPGPRGTTNAKETELLLFHKSTGGSFAIDPVRGSPYPLRKVAPISAGERKWTHAFMRAGRNKMKVVRANARNQ